MNFLLLKFIGAVTRGSVSSPPQSLQHEIIVLPLRPLQGQAWLLLSPYCSVGHLAQNILIFPLMLLGTLSPAYVLLPSFFFSLFFSLGMCAELYLTCPRLSSFRGALSSAPRLELPSCKIRKRLCMCNAQAQTAQLFCLLSFPHVSSPFTRLNVSLRALSAGV